MAKKMKKIRKRLWNYAAPFLSIANNLLEERNRNTGAILLDLCIAPIKLGI